LAGYLILIQAAMGGIEQVKWSELLVEILFTFSQPISEMLLDSNYRTLSGFAVIIEKEFLSFGHKVAQRSGHDVGMDEVKDKEKAPIFLQVHLSKILPTHS
jgi:hypothetical protein